MKCLRCESVDMQLQTRGVGDEVFEIDLCPKCGGIWLDHEELERVDDNFFVNMEEIPYADVAPSEADAELACPRCAERPKLRKVSPAEFKRVVVDTCPACQGFWLDQGELEKLHDVSDRMLIASLTGLDE